MTHELYAKQITFLDNEQVSKIIKEAIEREREEKKQNHQPKGIRITPQELFNSKIFKRGW